ncbi:MAG: AbrB/MazE/SpoVT family DNA-binding domain-containing protein [Candidatus Micrarchaeota archaeon]
MVSKMDTPETIETITVSSRGQIVIPEAVRRNMRIKQGAKLVMVQENERIVLQTEESFLNRLRLAQERDGWRSLSSKSMAKVWDNPKDDKTWSNY